MTWRPGATHAVLELRARLRRLVREFFEHRQILEVETPLLVSAAGADPNVPGFEVRPYAQTRPRFLHTSAEHAMKRLLCAGAGDIYQMCSVFRDGEHGRQHNPEFTMIEWYRLGYDHHKMAAETVALLKLMLGTVAHRLDERKVTYRDIYQTFAEIDPFDADTPGIRKMCVHHGLTEAGDTRFGRRDLLDLLFGAVIAPRLSGSITVVYDYPQDQAALARVRPGALPVAERFEVFVDGMELANGFHELADAVEQRSRFEVEQVRYASTGRRVPPLDEKLLAALESSPGLPDCAGVAVGFDRVAMLASGASTISDVMAFSYERS